MDKLLKEIDLIQDCIKRMANNSFVIKGWTISLVSIVIAIGFDKDANLFHLGMILLIPILSFWYLDSFFLQTEKKYRKMYQWVIKYRSTTDDYLYDLNPCRFKNEVKSIFNVMFSKTLIPLYFPLLVLDLAISIHWCISNNII